MKRQGDIYFQKVLEIPKGVKEIPTGILVYGEATGHAHRVVGAKAYKKDDTIFINVTDKAQVVHDEHKPITLEKGKWSVIRQREYTSNQMTKLVQD